MPVSPILDFWSCFFKFSTHSRKTVGQKSINPDWVLPQASASFCAVAISRESRVDRSRLFDCLPRRCQIFKHNLLDHSLFLCVCHFVLITYVNKCMRKLDKTEFSSYHNRFSYNIVPYKDVNLEQKKLLEKNSCLTKHLRKLLLQKTHTSIYMYSLF